MGGGIAAQPGPTSPAPGGFGFGTPQSGNLFGLNSPAPAAPLGSSKSLTTADIQLGQPGFGFPNSPAPASPSVFGMPISGGFAGQAPAGFGMAATQAPTGGFGMAAAQAPTGGFGFGSPQGNFGFPSAQPPGGLSFSEIRGKK